MDYFSGTRPSHQVFRSEERELVVLRVADAVYLAGHGDGSGSLKGGLGCDVVRDFPARPDFQTAALIGEGGAVVRCAGSSEDAQFVLALCTRLKLPNYCRFVSAGCQRGGSASAAISDGLYGALRISGERWR